MQEIYAVKFLYYLLFTFLEKSELVVFLLFQLITCRLIFENSYYRREQAQDGNFNYFWDIWQIFQERGDLLEVGGQMPLSAQLKYEDGYISGNKPILKSYTEGSLNS
ncbi:hypothetical protein FGO68_gene3967 [Halteria grandinella]|uniref:Uncharacterized protein n=1 Tax=Halteria grandinella TaxID=5974 RepID=A0A8J8T981_HALGN|nr:hypothetical protein FGO68_gene3967 [Halteria grandinella]